MVASAHYVPILLTRLGERTALRYLPPAAKNALAPLLAVPPIPWDYDNDAPSKSLDEFLAKLPEDLTTALAQFLAFIDLLLLDDDGPMANGDHPLVWLTEQANALGQALVPTVSPTRTDPYRAAVTDVVARDHRGACIRLQVGEWPTDLPADLAALIAQLGIGNDEIDLMLDLGEETGPLALTALRAELDVLPNINDWRSLIVAGAGMPKDMPTGQGLHVILRSDWTVYRGLLTGTPAPARIPTFADYGIAHPDPVVDVDPKMMSISGTFRYTGADEWLFARGLLWKGKAGSGIGAPAVVPAVNAIRAHGAHTPSHCDGEQWLEAVATGTAGGGSPTTWRRYGTSHHLQRVIGQIASLHGSLGTP